MWAGAGPLIKPMLLYPLIYHLLLLKLPVSVCVYSTVTFENDKCRDSLCKEKTEPMMLHFVCKAHSMYVAMDIAISLIHSLFKHVLG